MYSFLFCLHFEDPYCFIECQHILKKNTKNNEERGIFPQEELWMSGKKVHWHLEFSGFSGAYMYFIKKCRNGNQTVSCTLQTASESSNLLINNARISRTNHSKGLRDQKYLQMEKTSISTVFVFENGRRFLTKFWKNNYWFRICLKY